MVHTKDNLPVDSGENATPERVKKWKYLQKIAEEVSHSDEVIIELLICANFSRALETVQVIDSKVGGPYATRAALRWCIVGPIACIIHIQLHAIEWQYQKLVATKLLIIFSQWRNK